MRITVHYTGPEVDGDGTRVAMHVTQHDTVGAVKVAVTKELRLQANVNPCVDEETPTNRVLHLAYGGAVLDDGWLLADLHIGYGATIRAYIEEVLIRLLSQWSQIHYW